MKALQLDLFEDVESLPWNGRSPRSLTRGSSALFLRREPQKDERFFVDPEQYDLWATGKKARRESSRRAPLLIEPK